MFLIRTKLAPSPIHGIGVFTEEFIPKGKRLWTWMVGIDQQIPRFIGDSTPPICQDYLRKYAWIESEMYWLCADSAVYFNHSNIPNCLGRGMDDIAARDIQIGEELTVDYSLFDSEFGNSEFGYDWDVSL